MSMARKSRKIPSGGGYADIDSCADVLRRCLAGDPDAREAFVLRTRGLIRWALVVTFRRYGRPLGDDDLEDFGQEVLLALFHDDARKLRQYEGRNGASLATWLRVVVIRFAIDRIRKLSSGAILESPQAAPPARARGAVAAVESEPEEVALWTERRRQVVALITELSPGDQLFIRLFYYQEATIEEVSAVMGISRNAAYVRKMRLHRRLRGLLEKHS